MLHQVTMTVCGTLVDYNLELRIWKFSDGSKYLNTSSDQESLVSVDPMGQRASSCVVSLN